MRKFRLLQQTLDALQSGIDASTFLLIGGDADTNDLSGRVEQSPPGSSLDWHAGAFDVGGSEVAIQRGYLLVLFGRRVTPSATNAHDRVTLAGRFSRGGHFLGP